MAVAFTDLRHTYTPKVAVDFAGPSYFGGKNDQLILCAGKGVSLGFEHHSVFMPSQLVTFISGIKSRVHCFTTSAPKSLEVT